MGKLRLRDSRALGQGQMRAADPKKDRNVPRRQERNDYDPKSNGDEDPGRILSLVLENKAAVFLTGALPEAGQVMQRMWALNPKS